MTDIIFIILFLYGIGCLIAYCFIDFYNLADPYREKYSFDNAWLSWWTIIYLIKQSRKD
jgi:hypothetical protein